MYEPPPVKQIFDYDSPNDPKMSLLMPSGVEEGRSVFPQFEPPYENETESVRSHQFSITQVPGCLMGITAAVYSELSLQLTLGTYKFLQETLNHDNGHTLCGIHCLDMQYIVPVTAWESC